MKQKGYDYKILAEMIEFSHLKFRRSMTSQDFKLEDLVKIGKYLDFSLLELITEKFGSSEQLQEYTDEQEQFIINNPDLGLFFLKIRYGRDVKEAAKVASILPLNIITSLKKLEDVGLIILNPMSKIVIKTKYPSLFKKNGLFKKKMFPNFMQNVLDHFSKRKNDLYAEVDYKGGAVFAPFEMYLNDELAIDMGRELNNVVKKYRQISVSLNHQNEKTKPICGLIGVDESDIWKKTYMLND